VTRRDRVIEFRVLGPLEVRAGTGVVSLGGPKQRAVLALLLLQADEVVSVERLIDEVWGDNPPPSAGHSLEAYVSRLRSVLTEESPTLVRHGTGYSLRLNDGLLDSQTFTELAAEASEAATERDDERAAELATRALALWRGPALADVALGASSRAEAERLDELRLRVLEQRMDAELALEREAGLIGELRVLVAQNPYRERFVAQLMLALYRTGRHADALDVYERTRGVLDDVGLQPSIELQQLSGQIVRQEPQLSRPAAALQRDTKPLPTRSKVRAVGLAVGAVLAAVMAVTASGSGPQPATAASASASAGRMALVLPRSPGSNELMTRYRDGVQFSPAARDSLTSQTIVTSEIDPGESMGEALATRLRNGRFGLVLWVVDEAAARLIPPLVRAFPATRFVFVDASLQALSLEGVPTRRRSALRRRKRVNWWATSAASCLRAVVRRERGQTSSPWSVGSRRRRSAGTLRPSSAVSQRRCHAQRCSSTTRTRPSIARVASRLQTLRSTVAPTSSSRPPALADREHWRSPEHVVSGEPATRFRLCSLRS
jgi:DNA-binding SARP family transcriptional activator